MQPRQPKPSNANKRASRAERHASGPPHIAPARALSRALALSLALALALPLALTACSSTTLPWPDLSISKDEPDGALTREEQDILKQLLADKQKNHKDEAVKEIENR